MPTRMTSIGCILVTFGRRQRWAERALVWGEHELWKQGPPMTPIIGTVAGARQALRKPWKEGCFHRLQLRGWMCSFLYQQLHSCPNPHHKARMFTEPTKEVNSSMFWELYLKLLFFPGLLSNFLLSKGNLSPPISNIFSASCKKKTHYFTLDQGSLHQPIFQSL